MFFAYWIFAQKIQISWNVPVLSKYHLVLLHTFSSHCVSSCRKIIAFSTFFSGIGERKTTIPTQLTYFYVLNETKHSYFCFFCFCWWIDSNWEKTWIFNRTSWKKNHKRFSERKKTSFLYCVLLAFAVELHTGLVATFLTSDYLTFFMIPLSLILTFEEQLYLQILRLACYNRFGSSISQILQHRRGSEHFSLNFNFSMKKLIQSTLYTNKKTELKKMSKFNNISTKQFVRL